jgi:tRNA (guanine37-N1)-methyltransferase
MQVDIITIFPEIFENVLREGMIRVALEKGVLHVAVHDLRDYAEGAYRSVDERPYGGGPGMVLKCEPVFKAIEHIAPDPSGVRMLLMTPIGRTLNHELVSELAACEKILMLCGRYEGYDERIRTSFPWDEISIGDYVLSGGDVPAMVILDAVTRHLPGVLGDARSAEEDSFVRVLLDHPHYTRPEEFRGMRVPEVLLSGNHGEIAKWREGERIKRTKERRPDLLKKYEDGSQ